MKRVRAVLSLLATAATATADENTCTPVVEVDTVLRPGMVLLLGEIHGTNEGPAAVTNIACAALEHDLDVTVGLEIPQSENERIERYLRSAGTPWDHAQLLAGDFWQRDNQDGRSSQAMLDLIEALRALRDETDRVEVVVIDNPVAAQGRDRFMAQWLKLAIMDDPQRLFITLTGNMHNGLKPFDDERAPMGHYLSQLLPRTEIVSLEITHSGGTAWVCTPQECGIVRLRGDPSFEPGIERFAHVDQQGYSGRIHVGAVEASPPAKLMLGPFPKNR
jgi:hypothetical protein